MTKAVMFVVGARPNYMKVAPVLNELRARAAAGNDRVFPWQLVHTGQHYDFTMSDSFFRDLDMPPPDEFLGVGGGTHGKQTARTMEKFDEVCENRAPGLVVVVGDVNSTLACALVAAKRSIPVVHVEAGLRSYDRTMPEEINRVLTDQISDLLLITSEDAYENLGREGIPRTRVRFVGNPMIDSLQLAMSRLPAHSIWKQRTAKSKTPIVVVTLHRPANVDDAAELLEIIRGLQAASRRAAVIFPVHPRTAQRMQDAGINLGSIPPDQSAIGPGLYALPPLPYLEFLALLRDAALVVTDSGGIQEETTVLGIPCATLRPNTERPITITMGTNELVPKRAAEIDQAVGRALRGEWKRGSIPPLWDGRSAPRIVDSIVDFLAASRRE